MEIPLEIVSLLPKDSFYITVNGRKVTDFSKLHKNISFRVIPRVLGGKGGFGSLLRSFRIYKSTNQDMCRDLSGRRLGAVKEEERLKKWILAKKEREEAKERKEKEKYDKLKAGPPKHDFKDTEYNNTREEILEKNEDAFEQGSKFLKDVNEPSTSGVTSKKRSGSDINEPEKKKIKGDWGNDYGDISSGSDSETEIERKPEPKLSSHATSIQEIKRKQKEMLMKSFLKKDALEESPVEEVKSVKKSEEKAHIKPIESKEIEKKIVEGADKVVKNNIETKIGAELEPVVVKLPKSKPQPKPILDVDVNLEDYENIEQLEKLDMEVLRGALHKRGLKIGGSGPERAARLFSVKGLKPQDYPKKILAAKK